MWLSSSVINCIHGFSLRHGGISPPPFNTLNLGGKGDDKNNIEHNRRIALAELQLNGQDLCLLDQVHGATVCKAQRGCQEGDGLVTADKGLALVVSTADCYAILLHDPVNQVIGAVHAGWRGTCAGIAGKTVLAMQKLGADPANIKIAFGPGICKKHFETGKEVTHQFKQAGFPADLWNDNHPDLIKCNIFDLLKHGVHQENIQALNRCTFEDDFFSHRRDNGLTGRMWAVIGM